MLQPIAEDLWVQDTNLRLPGGLRLPSRATIVRLPGRKLLLHSPLAIDDATAEELEALGEVAFVVAPSCLHWMFVRGAMERYPQARVFGAPGLEQKLGGLAFAHLPETGRIDGVDGVRVERIQGAPAMTEHVFLHEPSRSLVVTDLMFNVHRCDSVGMRVVLRLVGAWDRTAQSAAWRWFVKDRAAAARSARRVLDLDFERVVVAHGDVVEDDARERTRRALAWMTSGAPDRGDADYDDAARRG